MFRRLFPVLFVAAVVLPAVPAAAAPPSCGDTIVADTTLTANLLCLAGDGLTIGADGVELDLGGFAIIGSPAVLATGVQATGVSDFVIRNGTVRGFDKAIVFDTATDGLLRDLQIKHNSGGVVLSNGSDRNRISRSRFVANGDGSVSIVDSSKNRIVNSVFRATTNAVLFVSGSNNTVLGSSIRGSVFAGRGARNTTIRVNDIIGPGLPTGIDNWGAEATRIIRNRITRFETGIHLYEDSHDARIRGNTIKRNVVGVRLSDDGFADILDGVVVLANNLSVNGATGLLMSPDSGDSSLGLRILGNAASRNGASPAGTTNDAAETVDDGIHVYEAGTTVTIGGNRANRNSDYGIQAKGVTDGGGNTAAGNGDPGQCFGVIC